MNQPLWRQMLGALGHVVTVAIWCFIVLGVIAAGQWLLHVVAG